MFGNYMSPDAEPEDRVYTEVTSRRVLHDVIEQHLEEFNNTNKNRMSLVVFRSSPDLHTGP